jgi:hypothetical protein
MRELFLEQVQNTDTGVFTVSRELPSTVDGTLLYVKNPRRIYVDLPDSSTETLISTLDNLNIRQQTTSISIFFSVEAKTVAGYDDAITNLTQILDSAELAQEGYMRSNLNITTSYIENLLVTELAYEFRKLL